MTLPFQVILNQNIQEDNLMPKWVHNQTHTLGNWDDAEHLFHCKKITLKQADKQMQFYFLLYYPTWC